MKEKGLRIEKENKNEKETGNENENECLHNQESNEIPNQEKIYEEELTSMEIIIEKPTIPKICNYCHETFYGYDTRNGINICLLVCLLIISISSFALVLIFLCICKEHKVCPNCGHLSGHKESNDYWACLC